MKKASILVLVLLAFMLVNCSEKPLEEGKYRINGTVNGLNNGEIYMYNVNREIDTIKIKNGTFHLENKLEGISQLQGISLQ